MSNDELFTNIEKVLRETKSIIPKEFRDERLNGILGIERNKITYNQLAEIKKELIWALDKEVFVNSVSGSNTNVNDIKQKIKEIYDRARIVLKNYNTN